jgi:signal transduction histidine kinase
MEDLMVETNVELELESPARLDSEVESTLYRLAQEALTNVVKHAAASRVEISLTRRDSAVELQVSDDGSGFDAGDPGGGFGLVGMRERVALAGGTLEIDSKKGAGTTLMALIPLEAGLESTTAAADR